jgi:hypothetical protein
VKRMVRVASFCAFRKFGDAQNEGSCERASGGADISPLLVKKSRNLSATRASFVRRSPR